MNQGILIFSNYRVAVCDFVIFPPRWYVAEYTFRPPWFHRNIMSEFMGNICGVYDGKATGFVPGSASLHSCMTAHGPDLNIFEKASSEELKPEKISVDSLSFMFETTYIMKHPVKAIEDKLLDTNYNKVTLIFYFKCWQGFKNNFREIFKEKDILNSKENKI